MNSSPTSDQEFERDQEFKRLRQHFDRAPYPSIPLETSPRNDSNLLFVNNLITSYYLRDRRVAGSAGKTILDAGCGTGFGPLVLAEANPGAEIVGIDLSPESIKLAEERLRFYGFNDVEFYAMPIEELPQLGRTFDYINCDETLYLIPNPLEGLLALRSVLKPGGIIRFNLHSSLQRYNYFLGQEVFKRLGLMAGGDTQAEKQTVIETMLALRDDVNLKRSAWKPQWAEPILSVDILANLLLMGDKGFRVADLFALIDQVGLEFVSMVNWRQWDVADLFNDPDNIPAAWAIGLEAASPEERLRMYELINPIHRLLDCWCSLPTEEPSPSVDEWSDAEWQTAIAHLHPQLRSDRSLEDLEAALNQGRPFDISRHLSHPALSPVLVSRDMAGCLLPLWDEPQPVAALVDRYLKIQSHHPLTLQPMTPELALVEVKQWLENLNTFLYVLLEVRQHG